MDEHSAGVIVKKNGKYLLLHYTAGHWDFPKGHIEDGETAEEAALRELKEESCLDGSIIPGFSHIIDYKFKKGNKLISKDVVFFIAKASGNVCLSHEHNDFTWLPFEDAMQKLTFKTAKEVLMKAEEWFSKKDE